ncbi:MAG: BMP family ABC transporter substrate-binding protein, partial [Actinomycetota bacterium]
EAAAVEPVRRVGVGFAPDLLAQIVADMADQPGALPLFQYTLTELFGERDGSLMSLDAYRRIGGLSGALSRKADAVYGSLDPEAGAAARDVFLRLVKPTEDRYTRRPVPVLELEALGEAPAVSMVLTRFGTERLLTFDRDSQTGAATVEVSHEALLDVWDRLAGWIEEARHDLAELDGLMASAAEWEVVGCDSGYLLTGARLADYEAWSESTTIMLPTRAAAYLAESIDVRNRVEKAESERIAREAKTAQRARDRLRGMLTSTADRAGDSFVTLTTISDRQPGVVFLFNGPGDGAWNDHMLDGVERAAEDYGLDIGVKATHGTAVGRDLAAVVEGGPELVLDALAWEGAAEAREVMAAHPEVHFILPDAGNFMSPEEVEAASNVSFPVFPVGEGAFLVGVVAARMTAIGTVGFIGGVDLALLRLFEKAFAAGVEHVGRLEGVEIEVLVDYLTPSWDLGGFHVPSLGMESAFKMHAEGADVIFTAAGSSGNGARRAAVVTTESTGVHRWHIGVDLDESALAERDPALQNALPHILTSMTKMNDVALYDALEDYHNGVFVPGRREYGLAEGGVAYATTGGYIDHLVPELEDLKERIIAGEIVVPEIPAGKELPTFEEAG